jgi:MSHA biogenesis protein MshN
MSVINKMLRDLDARQSSASGLSRAAGTRATLDAAGKLGYRTGRSALPMRRVLRWLAGLLVLAAATAAAWYYTQGGGAGSERLQRASAVAAAPAPVADAASSVPSVPGTPGTESASTQATPPASAPVVTASPQIVPASPQAPTPTQAQTQAVAQVQGQPQAQTPQQQQVRAPQPVQTQAAPQMQVRAQQAPQAQPVAQTQISAQQPQRLAQIQPQTQTQTQTQAKQQAPASQVAAIPVASRQPQVPAHVEASQGAMPTTAESAAAVRTTASQKPATDLAPERAAVTPTSLAQTPRQTAAEETLSQAQGLWARGSRDAALDLMREAVAVAERAHHAGTLAGGTATLASLVRELARMELAQGQVNRVLALLTRLEPDLAAQADLWAVRGNAAQRLGRHQESVDSYLRALALRSDESRWMLGAAVSLAALGKLEAAAELAEKARATGVVSPEILAYLRQAGVPIK